MFKMKWLDTREDKWETFQRETTPFLNDLYRVAMWLTRDSAEAEDLVQETMFQAMRSFHGYELGTNCRAWVMKIMHNLNAARLQKKGRMKLVDDPEDRLAETIPFVPSIPERITDEEVIGALKRVPDPFRAVLVLSDIEEFSYKEIASMLDVPIGTVMSRLSRGRKVLREELAEYARSYGFGDGREAAAS